MCVFLRPQIPFEHFKVFIKYIKPMMGASREKLLEEAKSIVAWHKSNAALDDKAVKAAREAKNERSKRRFARREAKIRAVNAAEDAHRIAKLGSLNSVESDVAYTALLAAYKNSLEVLKKAQAAVEFDSEAEADAIEEAANDVTLAGAESSKKERDEMDPALKSEDAYERATKMIEVLTSQ